MPSKVWDDINYPPGCTVGNVWEWINNFISHFILDVINYTCWDRGILSRYICCRQHPEMYLHATWPTNVIMCIKSRAHGWPQEYKRQRFRRRDGTAILQYMNTFIYNSRMAMSNTNPLITSMKSWVVVLLWGWRAFRLSRGDPITNMGYNEVRIKIRICNCIHSFIWNLITPPWLN